MMLRRFPGRSPFFSILRPLWMSTRCRVSLSSPSLRAHEVDVRDVDSCLPHDGRASPYALRPLGVLSLPGGYAVRWISKRSENGGGEQANGEGEAVGWREEAEGTEAWLTGVSEVPVAPLCTPCPYLREFYARATESIPLPGVLAPGARGVPLPIPAVILTRFTPSTMMRFCFRITSCTVPTFPSWMPFTTCTLSPLSICRTERDVHQPDLYRSVSMLPSAPVVIRRTGEDLPTELVFVTGDSLPLIRT